ncbi:hypothetical protein ACOMHN_000730 [Nucella lapillus]
MAAVPVYLSILFAIAFANVIVQGDGQDNVPQPEIAIVTAPHRVTVEKKSPLLLNCSVVTSPTFGPVTFTWHKDGRPLQPQLGDRRIHVYHNGSLYFRRIIHRKRRENRLSDEGLYECVAGNKNGSVVARRVHVEVACWVAGGVLSQEERGLTAKSAGKVVGQLPSQGPWGCFLLHTPTPDSRRLPNNGTACQTARPHMKDRRARVPGDPPLPA